MLARFFFSTLLMAFFSNLATAQSEESPEVFNRHKVMLAIGHTNVPFGINENGDKTWLSLPSWGLDYDFHLTKKWSIGLHSDIVVENFEVEESEDIIKKRSKPLASAIVLSHSFTEHFTVLAGGGAEFSKEENLALVRIGLDYGWELNNNWELSASLMSDFKINAYNAFVLALGVGKSF